MDTIFRTCRMQSSHQSKLALWIYIVQKNWLNMRNLFCVIDCRIAMNFYKGFVIVLTACSINNIGIKRLNVIVIERLCFQNVYSFPMKIKFMTKLMMIPYSPTGVPVSGLHLASCVNALKNGTHIIRKPLYLLKNFLSLQIVKKKFNYLVYWLDKYFPGNYKNNLEKWVAGWEMGILLVSINRKVLAWDM